MFDYPKSNFSSRRGGLRAKQRARAEGKRECGIWRGATKLFTRDSFSYSSTSSSSSSYAPLCLSSTSYFYRYLSGITRRPPFPSIHRLTAAPITLSNDRKLTKWRKYTIFRSFVTAWFVNLFQLNIQLDKASSENILDVVL